MLYLQLMKQTNAQRVLTVLKAGKHNGTSEHVFALAGITIRNWNMVVRTMRNVEKLDSNVVRYDSAWRYVGYETDESTKVNLGQN